jgi:hypothetical protein
MTGEWTAYVVKRDDQWGTDESIADDEDRITAMMLALEVAIRDKEDFG